MSSSEPVPAYKQPRIVFGTIVLAVLTGLLVKEFITEATWADIAKYTIGAVLGGLS